MKKWILCIIIDLKILILLILLSSIGISCNDTGSTCPYYFILPVKLTPAKSVFHVGDTISIVSKFSRYVQAISVEYDDLGKFDMKGIFWEPSGVINRIDTIDNPSQMEGYYPVVAKYFYYIKDTFSFEILNFSNGATALDGQYSYNNDTFNLEYKLVAKHPGIFVIYHGGAYENSGNFPGKCSLYKFQTNFKMNEGGSNNIDLLKKSPQTFWNSEVYNEPKEAFHDHGGYVFEVVP